MDGIKDVLAQVWAKIDVLLALIESKGAKILATAAEIRKAQKAIKGIWNESSSEAKAQSKSDPDSPAERRDGPDPAFRAANAGEE